MIAALVWALLTVAFFGALAWTGVLAVKSAKRAAVAAEILGGVFLLFGMGNIRDPSNDIVHQAKQLKNREDDGAGDPPN